MKKSVIMENNIAYELAEDGMYYPMLEFPDADVHYGKYGRMHRRYLMEHRPAAYMELLFSGKLVEYLNEVDDTAKAQIDFMVRQMAEQQDVNESLKERNPMAWTGAMNAIRNAVEELVMKEYVFS